MGFRDSVGVTFFLLKTRIGRSYGALAFPLRPSSIDRQSLRDSQLEALDFPNHQTECELTTRLIVSGTAVRVQPVTSCDSTKVRVILRTHHSHHAFLSQRLFVPKDRCLFRSLHKTSPRLARTID